MIRAFLSVGAWTLLSRVTGFLRDILLARVLGAGLLMDAFAVAFRLPNHFRAIFAEGAFSTAFIPAYTRIRTQAGEAAAALFQGRILSLVLVTQLLLLGLVLAFTPGFVGLLAPGFAGRPGAMTLATELTQITFPYLALITLVVLWTGVLNAEKRFVAGAAAPVLLNLAMISTLLAGAAFTTLAHAAAWGVLLAGILETMLLGFAAWRAGLIAWPARPRLDADVRGFFRAFGPAVIGAAGVQIAMFADTILVTFLPQGGASALYYADRLYQLPIGVIGIAAGTVLLPEMSRLIAEGRTDEAHAQQNRALVLSWLLAAPFFAGFLAIPEVIVAALFERGAFDASASAATAAVLAAYAVGLPAIVGIRSMVASFHARGDTKTPLYASLTAIGLNLLIKLVLWNRLGAAGLALATAIGAIVNFGILFVLAKRQGKAAPDRRVGRAALALAVCAVLLAGMLVAADRAYASFTPLARLPVIAVIGAIFYASAVALAFVVAKVPLRLR
ncbi:murein biosynthesis integral membrane protein MurJ [Rhabdaerophilum sp. SD176]|uniref:murein biosynthesis integral membrane protein MurJ n=1 Tax=Rhabdaerophilum sp. SD176 TaxID=2983548 RepID=UPI0024E0005C|nr:murein biosynthesis integral membrane protein MurJ [Rhabdaerophilum sp. SD176]